MRVWVDSLHRNIGEQRRGAPPRVISTPLTATGQPPDARPPGAMGAALDSEEPKVDRMNGTRLPFLMPWVKINLLIRSITHRIWRDEEWRIIKPQLRRARDIRIELVRETWRWN
jgi:hypothetical protein